MANPIDFGFFAPAGAVIAPDTVARATENLLARGHRVVEDRGIYGRHQRFAGTDQERLAAIGRIAERDDVDVAIAIRGGYGISRLLDRLDFAAIARARKRWMGHSDFTAFQLALLARGGAVSYAGPMVAYDFGARAPSAFTLEHCEGMLDTHEYDLSLAMDGPSSGIFEGTLWGGNLSIVAHLVGTPYLPRVDGGILFLEDTAEHPYRVERLLYQLHHAGVLGRQHAVLMGAFTDYELHAHDNGFDLAAVVAHARSRFGVPLWTGLPFGHVRDKLTLPVGGRATLIARDGAVDLVLRDHA
jgi:muramoyltetrapeptide carboxypeptidase